MSGRSATESRPAAVGNVVPTRALAAQACRDARVDEDIRLACADPPWVASSSSYMSAAARSSPYVRGILTDPYFRAQAHFVPQEPQSPTWS